MRDWDGQEIPGKASLRNHRSAKICRINRQKEENGLGSFLGKSHMCKASEVVKSMEKLEGWQCGLQAESPGQSSRGQWCIWGAGRGQGEHSLIARLSNGADPETNWEV